jgi:DNA processing protein
VALIHWLQLTMTQGVGPILTRRLIEHVGSAEAACEATPHTLQQIEGIGEAKSRHIAASLKNSLDAAQRELDKAAQLGVRVVCPEDAEYPLLLKHIHDPPNLLYLKGAFEPRDLNSIAIVGSRKCSIYGREQAERFGGLLGGAGFTVISGGARGIDSAAHRGAMQHPAGRTIAVLGSGVDVVYPPENKTLFHQIAERGAVVSEFPLGTQPLAENFPKRNRIVSGLSRGVLVIEAADVKSGALITARLAGEHGRDMFALPGRVDNPLSIGPHQLIRDGAIFAANLDDILNGLSPLPFEADQPLPTHAGPGPEELFTPPTPVASVEILLSERQQKIFDAVGQDAVLPDHIIEQTGLAAHEVMQELTVLSLKGLLKRTDGQFMRKVKA